MSDFQRAPGTIDRSLARKTLLPDSSDEEEEEDAVPGTPPSKRVGVTLVVHQNVWLTVESQKQWPRVY